MLAFTKSEVAKSFEILSWNESVNGHTFMLHMLTDPCTRHCRFVLRSSIQKFTFPCSSVITKRNVPCAGIDMVPSKDLLMEMRGLDVNFSCAISSLDLSKKRQILEHSRLENTRNDAGISIPLPASTMSFVHKKKLWLFWWLTSGEINDQLSEWNHSVSSMRSFVPNSHVEIRLILLLCCQTLAERGDLCPCDLDSRIVAGVGLGSDGLARGTNGGEDSLAVDQRGGLDGLQEWRRRVELLYISLL